MRDYRKIKAWQRAHALTVQIYKLSRGFSRAGHSKLRAQLADAAQGIGATIVEGCGASTNREFARFLDMSVKSANETEYHLLCARDFELISEADWLKYTAETIEIRKMIYTYREKVLQGDDPDSERSLDCRRDPTAPASPPAPTPSSLPDTVLPA